MAIAGSPRSASAVAQARSVLHAVPETRRGDFDDALDGSDQGVVYPIPDGHDADATIRALVAAQEQERRRIARDLHDVIGQALTAVKLNLEALRRDPSRRSTDADLRRSIAIVDGAMRDVRDVAIDLRPAILDDLGLVAALRWYLSRQGRQVGYRTSFAVDHIPVGLSDEVASTCFRAVQEALTNIARHARATRVRVELRRMHDTLVLVVEDDGAGFDVLRSGRRAGRRPTLGLTGMAERVSTIGGSIEITSAQGLGTRICARFPRAFVPVAMDDR
jgi:signal transduction histidine kinase